MKNNIRVLAFSGAAFLSLSALPGSSFADEAGDKVLASVDSAMNRHKTHYIRYEVINQEPNKDAKKLELDIKLKGEKRLTEFVSPADMKGTKVLILSPTQMYVYLPAFGKVRRIASHVQGQGFMGMTFSQSDFMLLRYSGFYNASILSDDASSTKLALAPKSGVEAPYPKIELTISKDKKLPTEIKYFNEKGVHLKTETRSDYKCEGDVCVPNKLKMVDHTKGGQSTELSVKTSKLNEEMSDEIFSKRALEK